MKPLFIEHNSDVTMFSASDPSTGVQSQLATFNPNPPTYNGLSVDDMRELSDVSRRDPLDAAAVAARNIAESANAYSKSAFKSHFLKTLQSVKK